jgi:small-conductance mechanosensitive channel
LLWIAMLIGFLVAVFWVIAVVVFIRGFKRWVHGDQIKQIEEDLIEDTKSASLWREP